MLLLAEARLAAARTLAGCLCTLHSCTAVALTRLPRYTGRGALIAAIHWHGRRQHSAVRSNGTILPLVAVWAVLRLPTPPDKAP